MSGGESSRGYLLTIRPLWQRLGCHREEVMEGEDGPGAAGIDIDEAEEQEDLGKKIKNGNGHRGVDEKKPGWEAKEPLA